MTAYAHEMPDGELLADLAVTFGGHPEPAPDTDSFHGAARMQTHSPDSRASGDGRLGAQPPVPPAWKPKPSKPRPKPNWPPRPNPGPKRLVPPDRPPMWRPGLWELLGHIGRCFAETITRRKDDLP